MALRRMMIGQGVPLIADGYLKHDVKALSQYQMECMQRFNFTINLEQESYLLRHPEVSAMLQVFTSTVVQPRQRQCALKDLIRHFLRPASELDKEIRQLLDLPPDVPYTANEQKAWYYDDLKLYGDMINIREKFYPGEKMNVLTPEPPTPDTLSSSFLSILTSASTLPTPEPVATPPLTLFETFFNMVSNAVDRATFAKVTDEDIKYDTAYVELMHAVEEAMEVPVMGAREDIAELLQLAYYLFEKTMDERDRIAAQIAWEKRMRKKLKRTLRRQKNFKGYETPPTPKSYISSHESYKIPPQPPCECHPQFTYNRYPKDRFGIYLPQEKRYSSHNLTVVDFSLDAKDGSDGNDDAVSSKSGATTKSGVTTKSDATYKSGVTTRSGATTKSDATYKSGATTKSGGTY